MAEFTIGEDTYKTSRMPALTEAHVARRLAPVINGLLPKVLAAVVKAGGASVSLQALDINEGAGIAAEFINFFSQMSDRDANFVIAECLSVTERNVGGAWSKCWNRQAQRPPFDDIRLPQMAIIVYQVMKEATADFMPSLGLSLSAEAPASGTTP